MNKKDYLQDTYPLHNWRGKANEKNTEVYFTGFRPVQTLFRLSMGVWTCQCFPIFHVYGWFPCCASMCDCMSISLNFVLCFPSRLQILKTCAIFLRIIFHLQLFRPLSKERWTCLIKLFSFCRINNI